MTNSHGLRTTGRPTGNFGRAKVQGKRDSLDFSKQVLNKENLTIPHREDALSLLKEALSKTSDPKLIEYITQKLKEEQTRRIDTTKFATQTPNREFWEQVALTR